MNPLLPNTIQDTDSYKLTHWQQYRPDITNVESYYESRGGRSAGILFAGLQYYLQTALNPITKDDIDEGEYITLGHLGGSKFFNRAGWEHILNKHGGILPLSIRAVAEGSFLPIRLPLMTVVNTGGKPTRWLTNYVETRLSQLWYPISVATLSFEIREAILRNLEETGTPEGIDFKLHDFGFRGSTSLESAAIGGLAHLFNFKGTDTLAAIRLARQHYGCPMAGMSIPAAEHSTITSWGRLHEADAYRNMLHTFPTGYVAVVSDSWDIKAACDSIWGKLLHDDVVGRDGVVVIRPDSTWPGVTGNDAEKVARSVRNVVEALGARFGTEANQKGYRVLNPKVRVIQGDGVDQFSIEKTLQTLQDNMFSGDNIAFGMGGALMQKVNRDTHEFAFKCSATRNDAGVWEDVSKSPIGMPSKASKPGRLSTYRLVQNGRLSFRWGQPELPETGETELMREVWRDGQLLAFETLDHIRLVVEAQRDVIRAAESFVHSV